MAVPAWPTSLGEIRGQRSSFRVERLYTPAKREEMDDGPLLTRNRTLFRATPLNITLMFTPAQFETFTTFTTVDLGPNAASRFTAPVVGRSLGVSTKTCKIDGEVSAAIQGTTWFVTLKLLVYDW